MDRITNEELEIYYRLSNPDFHLALEKEFKNSTRQELLIVHLLREADRRKIWAEMKFPSLLDYCVESFKISETDFYRKKGILETIREIPEIETKIFERKLNTTTVAMAITFLKRDAKCKKRKITLNEKREVFHRIEGKSIRKVQREFAAISPDTTIYPDKKKYLTPEKILRQYTSDPDLEVMIDRAKEVFSHSLPPGSDHADLLKIVFQAALESKDPKIRDDRRLKRIASREKRMGIERKPPSLTKRCVNQTGKGRPYISVRIKQAVRIRDNYSCADLDPITGKRCGSKHYIDFDHITPIAKGGKDTVENLRLACRAHNSWAAIREFGERKMEKFMPSLR